VPSRFLWNFSQSVDFSIYSSQWLQSGLIRMSSSLCNRTVCYHNFSGNSESPFATQFTTHNTCRTDLWEYVPGSAIALFASTISLEKVKVPSLLNLLLTIPIEWECLPYMWKTYCKTISKKHFFEIVLQALQSLCWPSQFLWKFSKVPSRFIFLCKTTRQLSFD